jgi:hypothetical protein
MLEFCSYDTKILWLAIIPPPTQKKEKRKEKKKEEGAITDGHRKQLNDCTCISTWR